MHAIGRLGEKLASSVGGRGGHIAMTGYRKGRELSSRDNAVRAFEDVVLAPDIKEQVP